MIRAGVFIGVDKTGNLQRLNDAAAGAARMHAWALTQGMQDKTHAKLIIDDGDAKVSPEQIQDAITEIVGGPGVDQLILYFAGHGVNINRNEFWLLTDAPQRTSAAINVSGSVELARYCGVQHVVVISDACRVAASGIQAQSVRGVDAFPNDGGGDRAKPVDQFYACCLGRTAAEVQNATTAAANFEALYTNALLDAFAGNAPDLLELGVGTDTASYVRPRSLKRWLESEIPRRVIAARLQNVVNQDPDAIITSDETWVARVAVAPRRGARPGGSPPPPVDPTVQSVTRGLIQAVAGRAPGTLTDELAVARSVNVPTAAGLVQVVEQIASPFGPDHFETECGFKVRGAHLVDAFAPRAELDTISSDGEILRVTNLPDGPASVLLMFDTEVGTVLPAVPGFVAGLTFNEGELLDVAYEPSTNSFRWDQFARRADEVRALRAVAASSTQQGRFRLEGREAADVARRMQYAKGIDPALSVYAAYAYHDLQETSRIRRMAGYLRSDIACTFFDIDLLARKLVDRGLSPDDRVLPFVPLLSQGWALLGAHRFRKHPLLEGIETNIRDSVWSLFDAPGVNKIRQAMQTREVR